MYKITAVIATLIAGFLGTSILGAWINFPDAGAICAIATMGFFILNAIESDHSEEDRKLQVQVGHLLVEIL